MYNRAKSHCRTTDFFGPNKEFRNEVPSVGSYTPELVPSNYLYGMSGTLKAGPEDNWSRNGTLSTHSSWNTNCKSIKGGRTFNFSRSASMKTPLSSTLPSQVSQPRDVHGSSHIFNKTTGHNSNHNMHTSTTPRGKSRQKSNASRRASNCSELTLDTTPLISPAKGGRAKTANDATLKSVLTPIKKK